MAVFTYGYTGSMMEQLAPWYDFVPFDGNLYDCEKGTILLRTTWENPPAHTCIVSVSGSMVLEACDDFDGVPGDSSGWEVAERDIHHNSWEWVGIPKGNLDIDAGIEWGRQYAADDSHGYSQGSDRMGLQCDCSSLVLMIVSAMIEAYNGVDVAPAPSNDSGGSGWVSERAEWQGELVGLEDSTGAGDDYAGVFGRPMRYVAIEGVGEYQAHDQGGDWWPTVSRYDLDDEENGMAGAGNPLDAIRIADPTVCYQTHNMGGDWNPVMQGTKDTGGSSDDFAGEYGVAQDAIRVWRENGEQPRYNVYS